jgi:tetratricopeptide (TPR) repeat protein
VVANPTGLPVLDVASERARVESALAEMIARGLVTLDWCDPATPRSLRERLRDGSFQVLHYIGHSDFTAEGDGLLFLVNDTGGQAQVTEAVLTNLLGDQTSLRLAILNSCEGARSTLTDPFAGIATSLVALGVPAVIAMQFTISDRAAIVFAEELFTSLIGRQYPVDAAVSEARKAVFTEVNEIEWATPVLFLRSDDGQLFDFAMAPTALPLAVAATPIDADVSAEPVTGREVAEQKPTPPHGLAASSTIRRRRTKVSVVAAVAATVSAIIIGAFVWTGRSGDNGEEIVARLPDGPRTSTPVVAPTTTTPIAVTDAPTTTTPIAVTDASSTPSTIANVAVPSDPTTTTTLPSNYRTEPLHGAFNVAVLGFVGAPADDRSTAREATNAATNLVEYLEDHLTEAGNPDSSVPQIDVGLFAPPTPPNPDATDVQRLAETLNADVVVGGTLQSVEPDGSSFEPTFAVRTDAAGGLLQLAGTYGLGSPATFARGFDEPAVRAQFYATVQRRSCVLVHLVLGLSYYRLAAYDSAKASFEQAIAADTCPSALGTAPPRSEGQEVAYVYLGNLALLVDDDPSAADAWYDEALAINPTYARAMFGKAEVEFQRTQATTCGGSADASDVRTALTMYDDAFGAYLAELQNGQEPVPFLATQGHLQIGRARLCLGLHDPESLPIAQRELEQVVTAYLEAPPDQKTHLTGLAAEAYAGLSYLELKRVDGLDNDALAKLDLALYLQPAPPRAAIFRALRAFINAKLGDTTAAIDDCASIEQQCPLLVADAFLLPYTTPVALAATGLRSIPWLMLLASFLIVVGAALVRLGRRDSPTLPRHAAR